MYEVLQINAWKSVVDQKILYTCENQDNYKGFPHVFVHRTWVHLQAVSYFRKRSVKLHNSKGPEICNHRSIL